MEKIHWGNIVKRESLLSTWCVVLVNAPSPLPVHRQTLHSSDFIELRRVSPVTHAPKLSSHPRVFDHH